VQSSGEGQSLEELTLAPDFRIRKRPSHDAGNGIAAMPHNFSLWRTQYRIAKHASKLLN
jgi:hypothetical protein